MATRALPWWRAACLAAGLLLAWFASAQDLTLSRLDADPVPAQVLAGDFDEDFVARPTAVIQERESGPHWWRITSDRAIPPDQAPHLVLAEPHFNWAEIWVPGRTSPLRRTLTGADADLDFSTRALVAPMIDGLAPGRSVYLRVVAPSATPMPVSIETRSQVHRADIRHVIWRTASLTGLLLLAALAFGFWVGIGERNYAYLLLTLLAQFCFFAIMGGEVRAWPALAEVVALDPRYARMFGLAAAISSIVFLVHYLDLRNRQRRLARVLDAAVWVMTLLILTSVLTSAPWIGMLGNLAILVATGSLLAAAVSGTWRRHRPAYFLLVSWLPMLALTGMRVGELSGFWSNPGWVALAFPASFLVSGMVLTVGLADTIQQLKRDRDRASQLATFDALTGALSRPAIEERLHQAVANAHRSGRPLSVVFFDIDRFKRINDDYGHRVGDNCLRIIGLRTRNRLRNYDLFGRFGGDEILVVLPNTRMSEALGVAENLRSAVNCRTLSIDGHMISASLSIGVAELAAGESMEHLLQRADEALYASKAAGRDRVTGHDARVTASRLAAVPK